MVWYFKHRDKFTFTFTLTLQDEVTWIYRKLHNEEIYDSYPSTNILRVIKSGRLRQYEHIKHIGN